MSKLSNKERQEWAKKLYLSGDFTQKEISQKVGCQEKPMGGWIRKFGWKELQANHMVTKEQQLKYTYAQLNALNQNISERDPSERYPTSKEADTISKLSAAIRNLEADLSVGQVIDVFIEFSDWLKSNDMEKAKDFINLQDGFIKHKLSSE